MNRSLLVSVVAAGAMLAAAGCKHKCCRSDGVAPAPYLPPGPGTTIPPAGVPVTPGLPPPNFGPGTPPGTSGRPAPEILLPDPIAPGGASSRSDRPVPGAAAGILGGPVKALTGPTLEPPVAAKATLAASTPVVGLPGFTRIKDGIATGRKPTLDGFDALKKAGYRTAIYLHPASADVSAVRSLAESRGLNFVAVETTPEKLPDAFHQVTTQTADKAARPAYVFDDDGARTGAVWYLHFRTVELESAEVAKIRARAIGLADGSEFWPAIRQIMAR